MFNEVIEFITESKEVNEYGDTVVTEARRQVFAQAQSIGQKEFYQAQATDLKPTIKFILADFLDYRNELIISYQSFGAEKPELYNVIKTYRNGNQIELTCSKGIE